MLKDFQSLELINTLQAGTYGINISKINGICHSAFIVLDIKHIEEVETGRVDIFRSCGYLIAIVITEFWIIRSIEWLIVLERFNWGKIIGGPLSQVVSKDLTVEIIKLFSRSFHFYSILGVVKPCRIEVAVICIESVEKYVLSEVGEFVFLVVECEVVVNHMGVMFLHSSNFWNDKSDLSKGIEIICTRYAIHTIHGIYNSYSGMTFVDMSVI